MMAVEEPKFLYLNLQVKLFKKTKAQFAIEFLILIAFMFFIFLGFIAVATTKILDAKDNERQQITEQIAAFAKNEIDVAVSLVFVVSFISAIFCSPSLKTHLQTKVYVPS